MGEVNLHNAALDQIRQGISEARASGAECYGPFGLSVTVSTYFADTLAAVQQVYDRFGGRDRRRIKRELRKARQATEG